MTFKSIQFKTDWSMFPDKVEREQILKIQREITKSYERHANPDYFRKDLGWYIAQSIKEYS